MWPLPTSTARERELWVRLWADGRGVEWERQHLVLAVANYVRVQHDSESRSAPTNARNLAKQLAEDLGLTAGGMLRNKWRFGEVDQAPEKPRRSSSRSRLTVVEDAG